MAGGMSAAAENFLISFYLEIIRNAIAAVMVAQEYFIGWMLKVKVLHGTSLACGVGQCHSLEHVRWARKADPFVMRADGLQRNRIANGARTESAPGPSFKVPKVVMVCADSLLSKNALRNRLTKDNPMNSDAAIVAHSEWKRKLKSYLSRPDQSLQAAEVGANDRCQLGQWMGGEGSKQYRTWPEFKKLITEHSHFHQTAAELVRRANNGEKVESELALGANSEFSKATSNVISAIAELRKKA